MGSAIWFALIGALFILMTLISAALKRLPLTAAIVYLVIGAILGKTVLGLANLDTIADASLIRQLTELAVIISLFTAGLKLRLPLSSPQWRTPLCLATLSMLITIGLLTAFTYWRFRIPFGAAVLLAAILAPTDPVLASSVQVLGPEDQDRLRFNLAGEAGLNDGTAFPFVLLGLGLLGYGDLGPWGARWLILDVVWGVVGGLLIGTFAANGVGRLVAFLRAKRVETESFDDFLAIGLIGLSHGLAGMAHANGFLAVFAAGVALRRIERRESLKSRAAGIRHDTISAHMTRDVLKFNEQLERIAELGIVILAGALVSKVQFSYLYLWTIPVLFLVIRPISVFVGTRPNTGSHRVLISWFGIRGIGPLYYLTFAVERGLPRQLAGPLVGMTFVVVVASIVLHGLSAAPVMLRRAARGY